ncbi:MAG: Unknown protein [uncultured Sulfurovum sp.]|uniref:LPS export ABC transporter periplasmic protein LptC n=1 Tax=uncultured Sulfurovum sp. TaxID=269237 RepID=A0A6S6S4G2_9BACT|nr:MAG: Unknown protein [uncultured Sulfurovum sp.]
MGIRIEYLLILVVGLLIFSILNINPTSLAAKSAKGNKEVEFQNIALYDIKQDEPAQIMFASDMVKYENHLDMNNIDLKDENGYQILSKRAIYNDNYIYMDTGVKVFNNDGLKFSTRSLNYNIETKDIKTVQPFMLEFNSSIIQGENLLLNLEDKKLSADNIEAKIVFVSKKEKLIQE